MNKLEYVIKKLADKSARAEAMFVTGVSARTLAYIIKREVKPQPRTLEALFTHFKNKAKK
jgi:hypothetical protein